MISLLKKNVIYFILYKTMITTINEFKNSIKEKKI